MMEEFSNMFAVFQIPSYFKSYNNTLWLSSIHSVCVKCVFCNMTVLMCTMWHNVRVFPMLHHWRRIENVSKTRKTKAFFVEPPFALTFNNDTGRNPSWTGDDRNVSSVTATGNTQAFNGATWGYVLCNTSRIHTLELTICPCTRAVQYNDIYQGMRFW